ncbi:hypothetical protein PG988_001475 [Apiospora saccharicola]
MGSTSLSSASLVSCGTAAGLTTGLSMMISPSLSSASLSSVSLMTIGSVSLPSSSLMTIGSAAAMGSSGAGIRKKKYMANQRHLQTFDDHDSVPYSGRLGREAQIPRVRHEESPRVATLEDQLRLALVAVRRRLEDVHKRGLLCVVAQLNLPVPELRRRLGRGAAAFRLVEVVLPDRLHCTDRDVFVRDPVLEQNPDEARAAVPPWVGAARVARPVFQVDWVAEAIPLLQREVVAVDVAYVSELRDGTSQRGTDM